MRVTTVNGKNIKRVHSIMYKDQHYSKEEDCVKIGGRYYPLIHPDIAIDQETKEYNLRSKMLYGAVEFNGSQPIYGFFSENKLNNVVCILSNSISCIAIREEIVPIDFIECSYTGEFHNPDYLTKTQIAYLQTVKTINSHTEKGYNIEDNKREFDDRVKVYGEWKPTIPKKIRRYAKFLGNFTFGVENEVIEGTIPSRIQRRHGLVQCRDGSVNGGEFVSIPMSGAKGVYNIAQIAKQMSTRTITDLSCSYHIHIGNINTSKHFLVSLYKLVEKIQDELFLMLPYYKTYWEKFKKKNYNQKLQKLFPKYEPNPRISNFNDYIRYNYCKIFRWLSSRDILPSKRYNRKQKRHPITSGKWNITSRYFCVNFVNALFSDRNTIEFRCFQNTTNPYKMVSWLFICAAIVKYAENNIKYILTTDKPITLKEVLDVYKVSNPRNKDAEFLSDSLNAYVEDRKAYFANLVEAGDYAGKEETLLDKDFKFFYEDKSLV